MGGEEVGDADAGRALDVDGIDFAAKQCCDFRAIGLPVAQSVELRSVTIVEDRVFERNIDDFDICVRQPLE
ncbi:hypothetical protein D3C72_2409300 [compost metagenome]